MLLRSTWGKRLSSLSDKELVSTFRETQDEQCFTELFNRYVHLVYANCSRIISDTEICKDLTMEVFIQAHKSLASQEVNDIAAWLHRVSKNECFSYLRKARLPIVSENDWGEHEKSTSLFVESDPRMSPLSTEDILDSELIKVLANLNDEQRKCIELFFFQRKSYKEIVQETGFGEKQVKSYLQNGKRQLRLALNHLNSES